MNEVAPPADVRWHPLTRVLFRFAFVYWLLYCWPGTGRSSLLDAIPWLPYQVTTWLEAPWRALCPWVAVHVFGLSGPVTQYHPTGSGDTTLDYVQAFCTLVIALAATIVWSVLDRRRTNYATLYPWLRLVVRFTLAFTLLSYGFSKVFPLQFQTPGLSTLVQTYGESSPMRLLWTFMGASTAYTIFAGLAEATAGTLLLFRRTAVLGALAAAGVMLNVVLLNYCYDVPVKLYSTHLFLMAVFLLVPEGSALWRFFVLHADAHLATVWLPRIERRWLRNTALVVQAVIVASVLANNIWSGYTAWRSPGPYAQRPRIYGVWDVDRGPWQRLILPSTQYAVAVGVLGERTTYRTTYDPPNTITMSTLQAASTGKFTYSVGDRRHLRLRGTLDGKIVDVTAHRYDTKPFLLTSRGFHWINEDPYNRGSSPCRAGG
ncbi:MAG: hypothetical protein JOZ11_15605, partial [Alphaproteobacteria bacterium]|nr:hypothetical protein [Alphaproteobacteria bacterium]